MFENIDPQKLNKALEKRATSLKKTIDGEPKNIDPLPKKIEPQMRLYKIYGTYFDTKEELELFCKENNLSINESYIVDYLGKVANKNDVIRTIDHKGRKLLYTAVDRDGYGMYNYQRSVYRGEPIWEFNYGSIREMYKPFRERGIVFEEDVYGKIDEYDEKIVQKIKELHLFNY